jgi:hypothetical protein
LEFDDLQKPVDWFSPDGRIAYRTLALLHFDRKFAARYLEEDTTHLAPTTRSDRERQLGPEGALVRFFGGRRLDEVTPSLLREWWGQAPLRLFIEAAKELALRAVK